MVLWSAETSIFAPLSLPTPAPYYLDATWLDLDLNVPPAIEEQSSKDTCKILPLEKDQEASNVFSSLHQNSICILSKDVDDDQLSKNHEEVKNDDKIAQSLIEEKRKKEEPTNKNEDRGFESNNDMTVEQVHQQNNTETKHDEEWKRLLEETLIKDLRLLDEIFSHRSQKEESVTTTRITKPRANVQMKELKRWNKGKNEYLDSQGKS